MATWVLNRERARSRLCLYREGERERERERNSEREAERERRIEIEKRRDRDGDGGTDSDSDSDSEKDTHAFLSRSLSTWSRVLTLSPSLPLSLFLSLLCQLWTLSLLLYYRSWMCVRMDVDCWHHCMYKYKLYYKVGFLQIDEVLVHCRRTGPHAGPALIPTSE